MPVSKERIKEIRICLEKAIKIERKIIEDKFVEDEYHDPGRSGGNGEKFNSVAFYYRELSKNQGYVNSTGCFDGVEEKKVFIEKFKSIIDRQIAKAKSVNHPGRR